MSGGALVIGEALVDEVVVGGSARRHPGGSPANVALGLARLGVPTRLHTALGDDADAALVRDHLEASGVVLTSESVTPAPTSKAVATLAADGSATYEFALSWDPRSLPDLGEPALIHTGSLGALLEPGSDVVAEAVHRGRAGGAIISLDPNVRASILGDPVAARGAFLALVAATDVVKLSDEDAEYLFPGREPDYVVDLLADGGASVVGLTRGARGALLASGAVRADVPPVTTAVADTVGAGDSFMAALLWALAFDAPWGSVDRERLEHAGSVAALAASITVSRAGADLPTAADLEEAPRA